MNLCQSDSQMQWRNLPPDEKLDLQKIVDGHCTILRVGKEKTLFWSCIGLTHGTKKSTIFQKLSVLTQLVITIRIKIPY